MLMRSFFLPLFSFNDFPVFSQYRSPFSSLPCSFIEHSVLAFLPKYIAIDSLLSFSSLVSLVNLNNFFYSDQLLPSIPKCLWFCIPSPGAFSSHKCIMLSPGFYPPFPNNTSYSRRLVSSLQPINDPLHRQLNRRIIFLPPSWFSSTSIHV